MWQPLFSIVGDPINGSNNNNNNNNNIIIFIIIIIIIIVTNWLLEWIEKWSCWRYLPKVPSADLNQTITSLKLTEPLKIDGWICIFEWPIFGGERLVSVSVNSRIIRSRDQNCQFHLLSQETCKILDMFKNYYYGCNWFIIEIQMGNIYPLWNEVGLKLKVTKRTCFFKLKVVTNQQSHQKKSDLGKRKKHLQHCVGYFAGAKSSKQLTLPWNKDFPLMLTSFMAT